MTLEAIVKGAAGLIIAGGLVAIGGAFALFLGWFIHPARGSRQ